MNNETALIYPYFRTHTETEKLFQPLSISVLAAHFASLGVHVHKYDCTFSSQETLLKALVKQNPAIIGIHSMITAEATALQLAAILHEILPNALLVAGGPMPTLFPEHYLPTFNLVFQGETAVSFAQFAYDYINNAEQLQLHQLLANNEYSGACFYQEGKLINHPMIHHSKTEIDNFPLPDRTFDNHTLYQAEWRKKSKHAPAMLLTSYGCPFNCNFCSKPVFGNALRLRNITSISQEIYDIKSYGYDQLWVGDDAFSSDISHMTAFCSMMRTDHPDTTWMCLARTDAVTREMATMMAASGCIRVHLGIESGSDRILKLMGKKASVQDGQTACAHYHAAGIEISGFFMVGYPEETIEETEATFAYALALPLCEISFNVPYPLPGTKLYNQLGTLTGEDWVTENEVRFRFNSSFDIEQLRQRISSVYSEFGQRKHR